MRMTSRVGVVGAGYVGLTSAVCLAAAGVDTVCIDTDRRRVAELRVGYAAIDEPGVNDLLRAGLAHGTLRITDDYGLLADRDVVFVCVPTPTSDDGSADLRAVERVVAQLADTMSPGSTVAVKSTVPPGTCRRIGAPLAARGIHVVANPEFLREGYAVEDFCHPDRVVIGADDGAAAERVAKLYSNDAAPVLRMSLESAELAKYASNAFLAVKLSFVNSLAQLSSRVGADIADIARCMGADPRIGPHFLRPGPGWGGSCLPKDSAALVCTGRAHGVELREIESARRTNAAQVHRIAAMLRHRVGRPLAELKVAVLGLTFKAGTSDIRDSPAIAVCAGLQAGGAQVTGYDPRLAMIDTAHLPIPAADDPYVAAKDADAIVVLTEWPDFAELDWEAIARCAAAGAVVVDTRNVVDRSAVGGARLVCLGNGTPGGY
ncbi:UDP-glucose/GDP-mannose dehydrogenase family protein [Mycolicibacter terrae]|uniref:UDP-glucose 6-dehydrogenase n=3 Tax=Mycobacteriaceae TaxID=1762 RepID=A0A1A2XW73_MYCSD|nr:UDP-glucose 6-dehydrogenase [Mycolicibacter sinensis]OBI29398.1 UDP-glucose 6-dehydrogenase [Mycolicibacter sinensis]RRR48561.1 UDP-glucose/GDP-mannose dehydrogenase family protein [Mycolicibacter terrae]